MERVKSKFGPEKIIFSLPDFFNPVKNGSGVQNQDKQSATVVVLNLTFTRDFSVTDKRYREVCGKKWNEMEKK